MITSDIWETSRSDLEFSQHTLFNWLRRRRSPTVENLRAVLNTLGYDLRVHKINRDEDDE